MKRGRSAPLASYVPHARDVERHDSLRAPVSYDDVCLPDAVLLAHLHCVEAQVEQRKLLAAVEDHVGALHEWPHREQQLVRARSPPGRSQIFRFSLFLLGNGGPPRPVAQLLIGAGLLPSNKARRDAWDAFRAFRDGTLRADAFYWHLGTNARTPVHGPLSWCAGGVPYDMRQAVYWEDAQRLLDCPGR
jgi:hypothetical protein